MRTIEKQMLCAIYERKDWRKDNTEVQVVHCGHTLPEIERINVRLHGNHIATIEKDSVVISDTGWQTPTTKSRLNALLRELCGAGISQNKFKWYLCDHEGSREMLLDETYTVKRK